VRQRHRAGLNQSFAPGQILLAHLAAAGVSRLLGGDMTLRMLRWIGFAALLGRSLLGAELSVVTWNIAGNSVPNWNLSLPEAQAAGAILRHLRPDVIALQEIPWNERGRVRALTNDFLQGYSLAVSPGTDFVLTSAIFTRHRIARSQSYLDNAELAPWGFRGTFTRDLFEAEIVIPGWPVPLHIFTTHLRAGTNYLQRAAEASAISNHLARNFIPARGSRPWLLCGDLNEDIRRPPTGSQRPIQRLANTNLSLTLAPVTNTVDGTDFTWSARSGLNTRFDYVLMGPQLATNFVGGELFNTARLRVIPEGLQRSSSAIASDHLPVVARFNEPFPTSFAIRAVERGEDFVRLTWENPIEGYTFRIERSTNLSRWTFVSDNLRTNGLQFAPQGDVEFFRLIRTP
jgi:endonuclease/exonuclease/phosphatase family metal-dependent hydrolase